MTELDFRTSRLFRVLGNPLRYKILLHLAESPKSPSELTRLCRRSRPATSRDLHLLHWAGLVQYRTAGHGLLYFLKTEDAIALLHHGRAFIHRHDLPVPPAREAPAMTA